jgi:hypothetical protein
MNNLEISGETYQLEEISQIIRGYSMLDSRGRLSSLLKKISHCSRCADQYPDRPDKPMNHLVRPLPLRQLRGDDRSDHYSIRIRRDHGFLRNLFEGQDSTENILKRIGSAKFAVGVNPWVDRCMLFRKSSRTRLMVIGIDYKHFLPFHRQKKDHNFPLSTYRKKNNIWGPTWRRFWERLLDEAYADASVNRFIREKGVFITNSMLCFGGSENPQSHFYGYLKCCREYIGEMIRIVKPDVIVSFGQLGCRNVVSLLLEENKESDLLLKLAHRNDPLRKMSSMVKDPRGRKGIEVRYDSRKMLFWPLHQPARAHIYNYAGDYSTLRKLMS